MLPQPAKDKVSDYPRQRKSTWRFFTTTQEKEEKQYLDHWQVDNPRVGRKTTLESIQIKRDKSLGRPNQQELTILIQIPNYCLTSSTRSLNHSPCRYDTTQESESIDLSRNTLVTLVRYLVWKQIKCCLEISKVSFITSLSLHNISFITSLFAGSWQFSQ